MNTPHKKLKELELLYKALGYENKSGKNAAMKMILQKEKRYLCIELDESEILVRINDGSKTRQLPYTALKQEILEEILQTFQEPQMEEEGEKALCR